MISESRLNINVDLLIQFIKETSQQDYIRNKEYPKNSTVYIRHKSLDIIFPCKIDNCRSVGGFELEKYINWLEKKLNEPIKKVKRI